MQWCLCLLKMMKRFVALNNIGLQDIIEVMQSLRNKTICDEAIKARLKTQSMTSSSTGESTTYQPNAYYGRNPYYRNGGAQYRGGPGSHYSSNRGYYSSNQIYLGDRISYGSKKYSRGGYGSGSGSFDENNGGSYKKRYHREGKAGPNVNATEEAKVTKTKQAPPPVGEEHYPSLSGGVGDFSPKSVTLSTRTTSGFGYAAALMKEGLPLPPLPPPPPMPVATDTKPAMTNIPASTKSAHKVRAKERLLGLGST